MIKFYDTHVHLEMLLQKLGLLPKNPDLQQIKSCQQALKSELEKHKWVVQSTVSLANLKFVQTLFGDNPKVYFLLGAHPEDVKYETIPEKIYTEQLDFLSNKNELSKKLVGIGEVGLDYYWAKEFDLRKKQIELFERQIELAIQKNLPLVIHCREAFSDLFSVLKHYPKIHEKFLIHCFTGNTEELKQILDLGGKVAFGGIITFGSNAEYLREALIYCPLESLFLETDLPFLSPNPKRGQINLPNYIEFIGQKISEVKGLNSEELWNKTQANAEQFFNLKLT